jgi:hypothetical protein
MFLSGDVELTRQRHMNTGIRMGTRNKGPSSVVQWSEFLATDPEIRVRFPALSEK